MKKAIEEWESRLLSVEEWKDKTKDTTDPCVDCGESTKMGSGNFVNRLPSDRSEESFYVYSYRCTTCGTPPVCLECEIEEPQDVHFSICASCEKKNN
jgi:hypothetical protein